MITNNDWIESGYATYNDLLKKFICKEPSENCYFRTCGTCPKTSEIKEQLEKIFEENEIEEISYKAWVSTDRCKLMNVVSDTAEFIDSLVESLESLVEHNYVAKTQSKYFRQLKDNLKEGELLVTWDFSENYPVVIQEAVQGY